MAGKKKKGKKNSNSIPIGTSPKPEEIQFAEMADPPIEEYSQPTTSPYQSQTIFLLIGQNQRRFTIPECYLKPYHLLLPATNFFPPTTLYLREVDEDIGHTLVHYLCTGNYETLHREPTPETPRRLTEFRRSVLVYTVANTFEIHGLKGLAETYIKKFDKGVPIVDILATARGVFPKLQSDVRFIDYLKDKLAAAYQKDTQFFMADGFIDLLGGETSFDRFLTRSSHMICAARTEALEKELYPIKEDKFDEQADVKWVEIRDVAYDKAIPAEERDKFDDEAITKQDEHSDYELEKKELEYLDDERDKEPREPFEEF
ncbi:hypothetical protein ASPWEDRAFT_38619 [Aspergillus wentii DTO 134E9]|uniref:BTB domain-containing protein n=1 Tax=Aspergillus wentii DTO 134E9 TaxID=1073089 RepID=A0A1L9RQ61_ASPWE|nr:uncharacterized protein ASPWEDRAFT_38619 [Aspergillus wentii DTO 134E9]KAI9923909.1 hypothetical protein MW887_008214 [Aspergillus wentii]OJJ36957.1 hypothetical protein ASPWEDRAFT_38619 [Aspergillus wentii DTO 134E9]